MRRVVCHPGATLNIDLGKSSMGTLGLDLIQDTQIISTGRHKVFVPENFFYEPDRTAVPQQISRRSMAQHVWRNGFIQPRPAPDPTEHGFNRIDGQPGIFKRYKKSGLGVRTERQVAINPLESPLREEYRPLLISLANNYRFLADTIY